MAFKTYTGWQWLLIDAANQFGKDKLLFEERIQWTEQRLAWLEDLIGEAENKPLYAKAVLAIRKAQAKEPTGHMVGVDACCSGIQMLSVLTGCIDGARSTGLIDPNRRADAYSDCRDAMREVLGDGFDVARADSKQALMTSFYGSKEEPKKIFGEDTPELNAFYASAQKIAPGAWELLQDLLGAWQRYAPVHAWKLPDGFDARIKVMTQKEARVEVDELDHATFTYTYYENEGQKSGISLPANVTHSVDAYVLRCMHRRCNYNADMVMAASALIGMELYHRGMGEATLPKPNAGSKMAHYIDQYQRSGIADVVILPYLTDEGTACLSTSHLKKLQAIIDGMLQYKPFPLVTVHDEFKAHANNVNWVRWQYKEILADIADSNLIDDLLSQIHGKQGTFTKLSTNLGDLIRQSNYGLC